VSAAGHGRPTLAIETYVRLMVLKQRHGWGYRTLVAEVSDSIHLRRFCRIALSERVPDKSTVRKLTRRIGPETVNDVTRELIASAVREKRFRVRAVRIDSTVIEADIKYPTDAGLAAHGVKALAREGRKLAKRIAETKTRVRDRSRAMGRRLREIGRTIRWRSGEAKAQVMALTEQTGRLLATSVKEARRLAVTARRKARGRGARAKLRAAEPRWRSSPIAARELKRNGISPKEVALDGGFIAGRQQPGSRRTQRRLQRYRTGAERISHLKRGYGLRRSQLKGDQGQQIWTGWGILAYNLDTLTIRTA